jgi:hypothetical protein
VIIRSWFGRGGRSPALAVRAGFGSAQLLQPAAAFFRATDMMTSGAMLNYDDVITAGFIPLR